MTPPLKGTGADGDDSGREGETVVSDMTNLYQEWTLEQDQLLWDNRQKSMGVLAAMLGRGLRGVESRLAKLKDVNSPAYQRLFADGGGGGKRADDDDDQKKKTSKLLPVSEVLRRIQWDYSLPADKFSVLHYDRVEDTIIESPLTAPNTSIQGKEELLVDALPEHRIVGVKYLERVVWDREKRLDLVFDADTGGIANVIDTYDQWKAEHDATIEWNRQRQLEVADRIQRILGNARFVQLKALSTELQDISRDPAVSIKLSVEKYVKDAMALFRQLQRDPTSSLAPDLMPRTDYEVLDTLSELVALLPDASLRETILNELSLAMAQAQGRPMDVAVSTRELPSLNEDDITETFVRGSGPGGQKINKTSNRVVLVHEPTQIRVECQDTRSLQQNRKIARKRLQLKLDEHLYGSQSKQTYKAQKASTKKSKAKARSRARLRKKQQAKEAKQQTTQEEEDDDVW